MNYLKNTIVGFVVSFVGSIPLGYLNVIGIEFYSNKNIIPVLQYLLGVVVFEAIVIYFTLYLAKTLTLNSKWKKRISVFTITFLLVLAFSFYSNNGVDTANKTTTMVKGSLLFYPLLTGFIFSILNFAQIPFWFSWNLYLINESYITVSKQHNTFYLLGAVIGTFLGMLTLIIGLSKAINYSNHYIPLTNYIWILFLLLALFQVASMISPKRKVG
ncbi:MAG: hypothetical protein V4670_05265 [Bacteroidota bacterium]